jgi:ferredoxin-NADP reductase
LSRLEWRVATLEAIRQETTSAKTLILGVPAWPGHLPGQHVDVRLTAEDGYTAQRSYSLASSTDVVLTVQRVEDGEVSPYLTDVLSPGDKVELRGPIGGWFVWRPGPAPGAAENRAPFRLLYSARTQSDIIYADELRTRARDDRGLDVTYLLTRGTPAHRIGVADVNTTLWPAEFAPETYICGPTGFVEKVSNILVALGHDPRHIRTERFG